MIERSLSFGIIILSLGITAFLATRWIQFDQFDENKKVKMIICGMLLVFLGSWIISKNQGRCDFLGKPLKVQDLATNKDFIVSQVLDERYNIVEVKKETGSWGIVVGLPPMAPETIFIVAERNGRKIVVPVPKEEAK